MDRDGAGAGDVGIAGSVAMYQMFVDVTFLNVSIFGMLHAAVLRSPHAHARITALDVEPEGVVP